MLRHISLLSVLVLSLSCTPGPQGVAGEPGPTGAKGEPGADGRDGRDGDDGEAGEDGTSCSVTDNGDGTKTISCEDGTSVTVTDGAIGQTGDRGPRGDAGPAGADGSLVRLESELGGPVCPYSGTQILSGIDDNGDGILQDDEVDDEAVVCSSSPGNCAPEYHPEGDGVCVSDTRDCVVLNGTGSQTWNGSAWGACAIDGCNSGYHEESGACVSDTRDCVVLNGTGTETWTGSAWGACAIDNCNTGYREESGACELDVITDPAGAIYAPIPAGTFTMGSPTTELGRQADETQHEVTLTRPFAMATTEVTQGQWKTMSGGTNPSYSTSCGDNCPVEKVDWYSTLAYANALSREVGLQECYALTPTSCADEVSDWADGDTVTNSTDDCTGASFVGLSCTGYRLPTEAEWEYAYRAGTTTPYYNGDSDTGVGGIAWYDANSLNTTHPVGQKTPNAWGLYDMAGNVQEWTWDWHGAYPTTTSDYIGPETGSLRVLRGGSWNDGASRNRAARRNGNYPDHRNRGYGFRLTRTLP